MISENENLFSAGIKSVYIEIQYITYVICIFITIKNKQNSHLEI